MITNTINIKDFLGDRIDPIQFHPERMEMIHAIMKGAWKKLRDVTVNVKTITKSFNEGDIYIGLENIVSNTGEFVSSSAKETISSAAIFKKGDILFPKLRPYLNKVHRAQFDGCCSTEFHVFKAKDILPDFLMIVLQSNIVIAQTNHLMTGNTLPRLQTSDIENLLIPYPSIELQKEIVEIYAKTQEERLNKIQEAKKLLDGIDDFLLETLQIEQNHGHVKSNKSIICNASSLIGNRLDVSYYSDRFEMISSKYKNVRLSSIVDVDPTISFKQYTPDTPISFIPMESIDEQYGEITGLKETTISKTKGYTKFEENDLLWAKITPCMQNGKSAIAKNLKNGIGCGSTEYFVMRPKNKHVLIDYIYLILRHHEVLKAAQSSFGGSAGQQRVSSQYLKSIMIPHPDLLTQIKIVTTIYKMKNKAKQLQQEGDALLEEAKKQIEKMILG